MRNLEYSAELSLREPSWDPFVISMKGLTSPGEGSITIEVPRHLTVTDNAVVVNMAVGDMRNEDTPKQILLRIFGLRRNEGSVLTKYDKNNESWLLGQRVAILNGKVAFMRIPASTRGKVVAISADLMRSCSPMAKMFKEKIVPYLCCTGYCVTVENTDMWTFKSPLTEGVEVANTIALDHLNEL